MQAEDQVRARQHLHLVQQLVVARRRCHRDVGPMRDWMCARRCDAQSVFARELDDLAAQSGHLLARLFHILADRRPDLDDRVVHLTLDFVFEPLLAFGEHLLDVRFQFARLGIDNLKLLFDAEREGGSGRHGGIMTRRSADRSAFASSSPPASCRSARAVCAA